MTGSNLQAIPGGWSRSRDSPSVEEENPVDAQAIPRSAIGTVKDTGEVVDQDGKSIGKIGEPQDAQQLAGNVVTAGGNIVSDAGDVLGHATMDEENNEYTTKAVEEGGDSSGFNLIGKTKGMFKPVGQTLGVGAGQRQTQGEEKKDVPAEAQETVGDTAALGDEEGTAECLKDEATDLKSQTQEDSPAGAEEAKETAEGDIPAEREAGAERDEPAVAPELGDKAKPPEQQEGEEQPKLDFSILAGTRVNKAGNLVNSNGDVIGHVLEGETKHLIGKKSDENGNIWNDAGKKIGKAEPLPDSERENLKEYAPFENFPDAVVEGDGKVTSDGKQVGVVVEGDPKHLKGSKVDEDGDILDRRGNVVGKAEAWDEPESIPEEVVDKSILAGKRVNKAGNVVSTSGEIFGRVVEGNTRSLVGRMCDKDGNVRSESGDIIGKAELVPEGEREGPREGPFAELKGCTVSKDGKVVTPSGDVVGRLVSGDPKTMYGRVVDEDGDIVDQNGNVLAKAERWEEPEVEKKSGPMAGRKVNREGNVLDDNGNIMGKLISGDTMICAGKEIDDDGDVINSKGNTVGHVVLLEDTSETAEDKGKREQAERDEKLAQQLSYQVEQSLDKIRPICKMITDKIDRAERTPKEELDEEELVKQVKPLIEEGGKILTEANGVIRGMDPDGRIQRNAKHKAATREASPGEFHLADVLKELTGTVTECIDNAKRKIEDMPHAKEELNPLWGLLAEPLFQILAAVGLLLNGVLGIVGRLLSGLGLGGLVDNLLGGLGVDRILDSLGLGSVIGSLTGKKK